MNSLRVVSAGVVVAGLCFAPSWASAESLKSALASAYANNATISSAVLSANAAAENIVLQKAGTRPTIGASVSDRQDWYTAKAKPDTNTASAGLSYKQTLFDNNQTAAKVEQARAQADASAQGLRNTIQNVLLQTATAYMDVVRDTRLVQLRSDNVNFLQAQVKSAKDRLDIGEGTKIDVAQAETSLAQAVAAYRTAINSLKTSQANYERWVGHKPHSLSMSFTLPGTMPASIDRAMAEADRNNPAILSALASIRAAQSAADAAKAAFGPSVDLDGSLGVARTYTGDPKGRVSGASASVSVSLTIPFYSGGALGAGVRTANINQIKSEVDARDARAQVQQSVIQAWSGVQTATAQINSAESAVKSAQLALDGTIQERDVGQKTTLDVLNARSTLISARESLITAQSQKVIASFSLMAAVGRLSAQDLNLPVAVKSTKAYRAKAEDVWGDLRALPQ